MHTVRSWREVRQSAKTNAEWSSSRFFFFWIRYNASFIQLENVFKGHAESKHTHSSTAIATVHVNKFKEKSG